MSAPLKRVCHQTIRHSARCQSRQAEKVPQSSIRCLSSSSSQHATQQQNDFVKPFPNSPSGMTSQDPDYESGDISALAHTELQQHRELRQLVRIAAWEMPLLSQSARPYQPPERHQQPLRWRYTTYMGEAHPASRKVVLEVSLRDLWANAAAGLEKGLHRNKFLKLAGARVDPARNVLKMSCESFETQAQNKRYLGDVLQALISEAKDPEADTFRDVPLDRRHVKRKAKLQFPTEWLLTEERKRELEARREARMVEEGKKAELGQIVSGVRQIAAATEEMQQAALLEREKQGSGQAVLVGARGGSKGAGKGGLGGPRGKMQRGKTQTGMRRR